MSNNTRRLTKAQMFELLGSDQSDNFFAKNWQVANTVIGRARDGGAYCDWFYEYIELHGDPVMPTSKIKHRSLTEGEVMAILNDPRESPGAIARDHGRSKSTVKGIRSGQTHKATYARWLADRAEAKAGRAPQNSNLVRVTYLCDGQRTVYRIPRSELANRRREAA